MLVCGMSAMSRALTVAVEWRGNLQNVLEVPGSILGQERSQVLDTVP